MERWGNPACINEPLSRSWTPCWPSSTSNGALSKSTVTQPYGHTIRYGTKSIWIPTQDTPCNNYGMTQTRFVTVMDVLWLSWSMSPKLLQPNQGRTLQLASPFSFKSWGSHSFFSGSGRFAASQRGSCSLMLPAVDILFWAAVTRYFLLGFANFSPF